METGKVINRISNRLRRRSAALQETLGMSGAQGNILNFIIMARRIIVNVITGFRFAKFPPETALAVLRPVDRLVLIRWW